MIEAAADAFPEVARQAVQSALNSVWQGALVVLLIWIALRLIPRVNAATRHAIWYATLVGLAVMPFLAGRFVSAPASSVMQIPSPDSNTFEPLAQDVGSRLFTIEKSVMDAPSHTARSGRPVVPGNVIAAELPAFGAAQGDPAGSSATSPIRVKSGAWIMMLAAGLVVVLVLKWTRLVVSLVRIRRIRSGAEPMTSVPGPSWPAWCQDARLTRSVWLGWSDQIAVPAVFGFVRPAILFPYRLSNALSEMETEQVALHELAHVARYDDWWQVLQRVLEAALFFSPATAFVSSQIALEREIACDDWVMQRLHRPREYADCLTRLLEHRRAHPLPVPGAVRSKKHIVRRIEMLLNRNRNTEPGTSRGLSALAAFVLAMLVIQSGFTQAVVAITPAPPPQPASPSEPAVPPVPAEPSVPAPRWESAFRTPRSAHTPHADGTSQPGASSTAAMAPHARVWSQAEAPETPKPPEDASALTANPRAESKADLEESDLDGNNLTLSQDGDEVTWTWSNGRHKIRAEMDGRVAFSGAGTAVESISTDGYFILTERSGGKSRELEIVPGRGGELEYYYFENKKPLPYDDAVRQWFAEVLPAMMRESGLGARERVAALRSGQGVTGVLREISLISSDYVKRLYFEELVESGPLKAEDVGSMFRQVGREMESDFEKAELLIKYADYTEGDPETRDALVQAVSGMESDYEVRRVLTAIGTQKDVSDSYAQAVLQLAMGMDSDYEKAELLLELADYSKDHAPARDLYLEAVAQIDSDYEKRRVLEGILMPRMADEAFVDKVLAISETLGSDYERVELLIRMADFAVAHDQSLSAYLGAVSTVDSDFEARRALSALPWHEGISDEVSVELLSVVSRLGSDYEKAEFLMQYGEYFTASEALRDAFDRAVDSIDSDYERQRVEASYYRHTRKSGSGSDTY